MENAIRNAIIKFEQEFLGRGPDEVRAFVVRDLVVVIRHHKVQHQNIRFK
ncbi:MAG: DUF2294 family protein [Nitrospira sp.]|nr:DUF2294 family protein [Nitrospira sp.]